MTVDEIMKELEKNGSEQTKKVLMRHGAKEPFFGVKVEYLKKIQKRVKFNHELSLGLYDTGNSDAMYLAGLIAEPEKMTKAQLNKWVKKAYWYMISCFTVPWVASESRFGAELAREWIESKKEMTACAGWSTFSSLAMLKPDEELDQKEYSQLLDRVQAEIHGASNRVRSAMNNYVIAVGASISGLTAKAKAVSKAIGKVEVDMGDTSCQVPDALAAITKIEQMGRIGRKRKSARC